ncbi:MAG TPA: threonine synthase [Pyrinomonadaceae bacterium]|nr:threonine synthase [Pyrinomonadaceae bacterium]
MFLQRCIETKCRAEYGLDERVYVCSRCGGLLDIERVEGFEFEAAPLRELWLKRRSSADVRDRSGVWRFREFLPFENDIEVVSLEEGNTPLYDAPRSADYCHLPQLKLKHQGCNPTGSFKDTGMTIAVTQARKLGARTVVCASTGNTAASLAAYAARAELLCTIIVPAGQISHAKLAQALDYGAKVLEIDGNFDACMNAVRDFAEDQSVYLVNSINPFRIEGQKTVAFELAEQLGWRVPDQLVVPGGNLGNSSAFGKGFRELARSGLIERQPKITVVQAAGAAPFAHFYADASQTFVNEEHPQTLASAIKIGAPVSWQKAWRAVSETSGSVITVTEQEIADAKAMIGRDGIGCEPASATTVAGIRKLVEDGVIKADESVVAVLTGHLLKDTDYVMKYHSGTLVAPDGSRIVPSSAFIRGQN